MQMERAETKPDLIDSLAAVVAAAGLDAAHLTVGLTMDDKGAVAIPDRTQVLVSDRKSEATWVVPSLRALFRGDRRPPDMMTPPDEYVLFMYPIEQHVLILAGATGRPATDDDIMEAFSTLRRRPDGRSAGKVHDVLWQATALALGLRPTGQAEFEALMGRLELSVRRWRRFSGSTAYSEFLLKNLPG